MNESEREKIVAQASEFLARHHRVLMEVRFRRDIPMDVAAVATVAHHATSNSNTGRTQSIPPNPATPSGRTYPLQRGNSGARSPTNTSVTTAEGRDGICSICGTRKMNSVCSNRACKSCCHREGYNACSVHKHPGFAPPEAVNQAKSVPVPANAYPASSVAASPHIRNIPATSSASLPPSVVCPWCKKPHDTKVSFREHVRRCWPGFIEMYPQSANLNESEFIRFCWTHANTERSASATAGVANTASGSKTPQKPAQAEPSTTATTAAKAQRVPAASTSLSITESNQILPTRRRRRVAPTISMQAMRELQPEVHALLPQSVVREQDEVFDQPMAYEEFVKMCTLESIAPHITEQEAEDALTRYTSVSETCTSLFSSQIPMESIEETQMKKSDTHFRFYAERLKHQIVHTEREQQLLLTALGNQGKRIRGEGEYAAVLLKKVRNGSQGETKQSLDQFSKSFGIAWRWHMPALAQRRQYQTPASLPDEQTIIEYA